MVKGNECARGGFTLLEVLLVLMLISLAGVLVYPNLQPQLQRTRREAALRKMSASLDDLRRRAVVSGEVLVLAYDEDEGLLLSGKESEGEPETMEVPEETRILSMEPALLMYFPQGHSSGAVLEVGQSPGRFTRIEVGSFTGLARIVREEAE